jgi:murein DD-endopeptidase MepM/ murein hydrolase activator NlpD
MSKPSTTPEVTDNTPLVDEVVLTPEEIAKKEAEREAAQVAVAEASEAGDAEKLDAEATADADLEKDLDGVVDSDETEDPDETENSGGTDDLDSKAQEVIDTLEGGGKIEDIKESFTELLEYLKKYVSGLFGMTALGEAMSMTGSSEQIEKENWLWPNASHFTFGKGPNVNPVVTSNPQADRGEVENKDGEIVSHGAHRGVDIAGMPAGTPIIMAQKAKVVKVQRNREAGLRVTVRFDDGTEASFGHMDAIHVEYGESLDPGSTIGTVGTTGNSTGNHVHYQTYAPDGSLTDPFPMLAGSGLAPEGGFANYKFPWGQKEEEEGGEHDH